MIDTKPLIEEKKEELLTEMLMRLSILERIIIDKKIISITEYKNLVEKSVSKLVEAMGTENKEKN